MTIWILLTLALGAITGTADSPLLRQHCAKSIAQSRTESERRVSSRTERRIQSAHSVRRPIAASVGDPFRLELLLARTAAPRAPAAIR